MENYYRYNLTGMERKAFVESVSKILGEPAVYQKAPSFSYRIGGFMVDRSGTLSRVNDTSMEALDDLVKKLECQGYTAEKPLTIELPATELDEDTRRKLLQIIESKQTLIRQALGADSLSVVEHDGRATFPWFTLRGTPGEADTYARFVAALVSMAKNRKRITAKEKPVENAKFSMRLFLVQLGFIGDEYKTARKILLRNLSGNSSWKSGPPQNRRNAGTGTAEPAPAEPAETETNYGKGGAPYDQL